MQQLHDQSVIERANLRHERERIRTIGWIALGLGIFCWFVGGLCLIAIPYSFFGNGASEPWLAVAFGFPAVVGGGLAIAARSVEGKRIHHAEVAVVLNTLFLIVVVARVVQWW
jgi:hypothetical protein